MPARRRNPDSTTVRIEAWVSPETRDAIRRVALSRGITVGALLDKTFVTSPDVVAEVQRVLGTGRAHEFQATSSGLVKLCKHCGAGEKSPEGRSPTCPSRSKSA